MSVETFPDSDERRTGRLDRGELPPSEEGQGYFILRKIYEGQPTIYPGAERLVIREGDMVRVRVDVNPDEAMAETAKRDITTVRPASSWIRRCTGLSPAGPSPAIRVVEKRRRHHRLAAHVAASAMIAVILGGGTYEVATAFDGLNSPTDFVHDFNRGAHSLIGFLEG